jgi:sugar phosphate isomerase/epimerase
MKIFAQTFTLNPQTPIETISLAHQQGFQGVEITCEYPRGPLDYTPEAISKVKGLAQEYDMPLQVHAPYKNLRPADLNPRIRDASIQSVKDGIDFAGQIDCRIVTVHLGSVSKGRLEHAHKSVRVTLLDYVRTLTDYAVDHDITIAIENVQSDREEWEEAVGKTAEEIVGILKEIDAKNVGVTFDVGHANTVGNPNDFAVKLAPYVVNVHLHDNDGTRDQHLVIGEGKIDFLKILRTLKEIGYTGPLVLEYFDPASLLRAKTELVKLLKRL